jgi:protocatechuate 3,4-dioxygenase, beta subunit
MSQSGLIITKSHLDMENEAPLLHENYRSTARRAPRQPLIYMPHTQSERTAPVFGSMKISESDYDLTRQHSGEPIGQRMIVEGRVIDDEGRPLPSTLVEIWQTNAAGRYRHKLDDFNAPLDPNFSGFGRMLTDQDGKYRFLTVKPGAYPWNNHRNAWRPAHIHFSLFGPSFISRFVTQMYFVGDPMLELDPVFQALPDKAKPRVLADFDIGLTEEKWALGYRFDMVLRGPDATPEHD